MIERAYIAGNEKIAGQIVRAADGWDLDEPFTEENVQALWLTKCRPLQTPSS